MLVPGDGSWDPGLVSGTLWIAPEDLVVSTGPVGCLHSLMHAPTQNMHSKVKYSKSKTTKSSFLKVSCAENERRCYALLILLLEPSLT